MSTTVKLKAIRKISSGSKRYDIQVDGNQNFFANGILVHNCTMYTDGFHARSIDSRHHPSRDWLARFHASIAHDIPAGWRICGENLYAQHSIAYTDLPSYFMGFSVWNEENVALSWDDTLEMFELLGIIPVPELYRGPFDEAVLKRIAAELDTEKEEGFVVRVARPFHYDDFKTSIAKWVRSHHVQTDKHWMHRGIVPNGLAVTQETK